jgi:hypothetical protein
MCPGSVFYIFICTVTWKIWCTREKIETEDALLHYILDAAARIKENHNELIWATRMNHTLAKMHIEVEGGNFERYCKQLF